jgi:hypothetical protein
MSAAIDTYAPSETVESHRRKLLAESDTLLDQVEELRLGDRNACPPSLSEAIRSLQLRLGRVDAHHPHTVRAAHRLVFAVQARLMAANPRNPHPQAPLDRPTGQPTITILRQGGAWKFLTLPPRPPSTEPAGQAEWRLLVELTVQRALDRWAYAQDEAVNAARAGVGTTTAVSRARAAWRNYWDLHCEAEACSASVWRDRVDRQQELAQLSRGNRRSGPAHSRLK